MPINPGTEITHPELGPMGFNDGKQKPGSGSAKHTAPQWLCRPDGWDSDFEIYLPGDVHAPQAIDQAIVALSHRKQIEAEGKGLCASNAYLFWIDLRTDPTEVAFVDDNQTYVIWKGRLDKEFRIKDLKQEAW